ncbi:MAG: hypothetical protein AW09_001640 [Candidatus Accumulibacter phosphatis]|jgi:hypothetical protein|uniref:Uncharacterized protein n=1 Tax=Candidatus Accumulibacter phosphatis TaxID=327160 RepID=A0A080LWQ0_9PROT|nr:MAG: hypothetical protein AW09_001640 [Candidatus Accumulibacter phosphatis]
MALPDPPEIASRGKAGQLGDSLDRELPLGEQFARPRDAQPLLIPDDTDARVLGKQACQMAGADMRLRGKLVDRPRTRGILRDRVLRAMDGGVQVVAVGEPRRELRIVAAAALVDDQPA